MSFGRIQGLYTGLLVLSNFQDCVHLLIVPFHLVGLWVALTICLVSLTQRTDHCAPRSRDIPNGLVNMLIDTIGDEIPNWRDSTNIITFQPLITRSQAMDGEFWLASNPIHACSSVRA